MIIYKYDTHTDALSALCYRTVPNTVLNHQVAFNVSHIQGQHHFTGRATNTVSSGGVPIKRVKMNHPLIQQPPHARMDARAQKTP
jgi:hypothetical protein